MRRAPGATSDWGNRVGSDPWRNLLADEAAQVRRFKRWGPPPEPPRAVEPAADATALPPHLAFGVRSLPAGVTSADHSFLVFQVGRMFLVGPTGASMRTALRLDARQAPNHFVLLSWGRAHLEGLQRLPELRDVLTAGWMPTVWTSSWIWEESLRLLAEEGPASTEAFHLLRRLTCLSAEEAQDRLMRTGEVAAAAVLCEESLDLKLDVGVGVRLRYVPSAIPSLSVAFRCNGREITLDPLNALRTPRRLDKVRRAMAERIALVPSLQEPFRRRYGGPESLVAAPLPDASGQWASPDGVTHWEFADPVDVEMLGRARAAVEFRARDKSVGAGSAVPLSISVSKDEPPPPASEEELQRARECLDQTVIAIFCGGPMGAEHMAGGGARDVLHPGRPISIRDDSGRKRSYSIIEWRLRQVGRLTKQYGVDLPVLVLTSPATEHFVAQAVASVAPDFPRVEPVLLRQQLVPRVTGDDDLQPLRRADGGWSLLPRGHADFLPLLLRWRRGQVQGRRRFCFAFAHNNLGRLLDRSLLVLLAGFAEMGRAVGVELFALPDARTDRRSRRQLMSFAPEDELAPLRLYKRHAYPPPSGEVSPPGARYSSHTWYFDLDLLEHHGDISFERYTFRPEAGAWHPRQDLEQVTHQRDIGTIAILTAEGEHPVGPYPSLRFLFARSEDERRDPVFQHAFAAACRSSADQWTESPHDIDRPLIELVPAIMNYVWGGFRLSTLKRWSAPGVIAETWEVSTHPSGVSMAYGDIRTPVPLTDVVDGDFPFMAKYLDCHEPLSIQVHPNRATAEFLSAQNRQSLERNASAMLPFVLQDDEGKEESFYVLESSPASVHLYLGFDRRALAPIAVRLRPILAHYAAKGSEALPDCYRKILESLRESIAHECHRLIGGAIGPHAPLGDVLAQFADEAAQSDDPWRLSSVLAYHVEEYPRRVHSQGPPLSLLGNEYLFAAIAVIRLIEVTATVFGEQARRLFDSRADGFQPDQSFLRYFHAQQMAPGQWGRVPPGTVHSWQGGGNFVVELSGTSDNTFRILDFGREFTEPRQMHYLEAMYALSPDGILTAEASGRLVSTPKHHEDHSPHSALTAYIASGKPPKDGLSRNGPERTSPWLPLPTRETWSVLMNPHNPVRVRTTSSHAAASSRERFAEVRLDRCRALLMRPHVSAEVLPAHPDDRLLVIGTRRAAHDVLCISLGATKLELALFRDGDSPPVVWHHAPMPRWAADAPDCMRQEDVVDAVGQLLATFARSADTRSRRRLNIGVSWPGQWNGTDLVSSTLGRQGREGFANALLARVRDALGASYDVQAPIIRDDASWSVLGERRHARGRLPADGGRGSVLNVGAGLRLGLSLEVHPSPCPHAALRACGAVGRWLFVDPHSGRMIQARRDDDARASDVADELVRWVFEPNVPLVRAMRGVTWLRTSAYLSSPGIACRYALRLGAEERRHFLDEIAWPAAVPEPAGRADITASIAAAYDSMRRTATGVVPHAILHRLNADANEGGAQTQRRARDFIVDTARDIAAVVQSVQEMLIAIGCGVVAERLAPIVLTGAVGENLGRLQDGDLLVDTIADCLGAPGTVIRSEIAISSVRETEGVRQFFEAPDGQ
jgi:hypothetical protein